MFADITAELNALGVCARFFMNAVPFPNPEFLKSLIFLLRNGEMPSFILSMNAKTILVIGEKDGRPFMMRGRYRLSYV